MSLAPSVAARGDDAFEHRGRRPFRRFISCEELEFRGRRIDNHVLRIGRREIGQPFVAVVAVQRRDDFILERQHRLDLTAGREAKIVECRQVLGHRERHEKRRAGFLQREGRMSSRNLFRERGERIGIHRVRVDAGRGHAQLRAQDFQQRVGRHHAVLHEDLAEPTSAGLLFLDRDVELRLVNEPPFDEQCPQGRVPVGDDRSKALGIRQR